MINVDTLMQVKAFARQDGFFLSLIWIASFVSVVVDPASFIGTLLLTATPFFVGWRLIRFRDGALGGSMSFRRAWAYVCYTFFYAALVLALAQYVYFQFLDHGSFLRKLTDNVATLAPVYRQNGIDIQPLYNSINVMRGLKPIEITFILMMDTIFMGFLASPLIALFGRKKQGRTENL